VPPRRDEEGTRRGGCGGVGREGEDVVAGRSRGGGGGTRRRGRERE